MRMLTPRQLTSILAVSFVAVAATPATAQDAAAVKRGTQVYAAQKCSTCHSIAGAGSARNPLDGVGKKLTVEDIRLWITTPVAMAAKVKSTKKPVMQDRYSKLPAAEIDGLVAYMQSLK